MALSNLSWAFALASVVCLAFVPPGVLTVYCEPWRVIFTGILVLLFQNHPVGVLVELLDFSGVKNTIVDTG